MESRSQIDSHDVVVIKLREGSYSAVGLPCDLACPLVPCFEADKVKNHRRERKDAVEAEKGEGKDPEVVGTNSELAIMRIPTKKPYSFLGILQAEAVFVRSLACADPSHNDRYHRSPC